MLDRSVEECAESQNDPFCPTNFTRRATTILARPATLDRSWKQQIRCYHFQPRGELQRLRPVCFTAAHATACSFEEPASTEFPSAFPSPYFSSGGGSRRIHRGGIAAELQWTKLQSSNVAGSLSEVC